MECSRSNVGSGSDIKTPATTILSPDNGRSTTSVDEKTDEPEYITGLALVASVASLTLAIFLMLLDTSIVSTAIPQITTNFHSLNDVGWYGTAYLMAVCSVQPLSGKMYTYFNSKWTFLSFFTIFELGSTICGAADSSYMLIVGRAIAGIGSSGLLNGAFTILHASFPARRLPALTGILMGITQLGSLSGPLIGGALTQHASWRWCFYINLPCAAAINPALFLIHIPDGRTTTSKSQPLTTSLRHLDIPGFILFGGTMIQLLCALNWGGTTYPWHSSTIIGLFCGTGGTLLVFLLWEVHTGPHALIALELVKRRIIWSSCLNYAFMIGSAMCFTYYLPMYFQAVRDASPTKSGVDLLPAIVTTIVFAILSGILGAPYYLTLFNTDRTALTYLVGKLGYYLPFAIASGAMTTIGAALFTTLTPATATRNWVGFQLLQGTGRGLGVQMPLIAVQTAAPREMHSVATGLVVLAQNVGPAIFLGVCQVVFSGGLEGALGRFAPGVDGAVVEEAGARGLRGVVGEDLEGVLRAYNEAVVDVFYVSVAAAAAALVFACGMGWVSVKDGEKNSKL